MPDLGLSAPSDGDASCLASWTPNLTVNGERASEALADPCQRDPVLGPPWTSQAGLHRAEVEVEQLAEHRRWGPDGVEQPLLLAVALDQVDVLAGAAGDF